MAQTILTRPQNVTGGIPGTITTGVIIPFGAGTNVVEVDAVAASANASVKWIYTLMSPSQDKVVTGEVVAVYRLVGNSVTHNRSSVVGDKTDLKHSVDVVVSGSQFALEITNLSAPLLTPTDYTANIVRIQMLS